MHASSEFSCAPTETPQPVWWTPSKSEGHGALTLERLMLIIEISFPNQPARGAAKSEILNAASDPSIARAYQVEFGGRSLSEAALRAASKRAKDFQRLVPPYPTPGQESNR